MGQELTKQKPPTNSELSAANAKVVKAKENLALEMAQIAADAAGILDPTPISDAISAGISIARGDWWGAALSALSMIPYAGDAIAKPIKAVKASKAVIRLKRTLSAAVTARKQLEASVAITRKQAATAIQRARAVAAKAEIAAKKKLKQICNKNPFGTHLPADEKSIWKDTKGGKGVKGDSNWTPSMDNPDRKAILAATKGKPIKFNNGYPNFNDFAITHNGKPAIVNIDMKGYQKIKTKDGRTMSVSPDFSAANRKMKELDPKWKQPANTTWHHHENGTSMVLVPSDINNKVPHSGGGAIVGDVNF